MLKFFYFCYFLSYPLFPPFFTYMINITSRNVHKKCIKKLDPIFFIFFYLRFVYFLLNYFISVSLLFWFVNPLKPNPSEDPRIKISRIKRSGDRLKKYQLCSGATFCSPTNSIRMPSKKNNKKVMWHIRKDLFLVTCSHMYFHKSTE